MEEGDRFDKHVSQGGSAIYDVDVALKKNDKISLILPFRGFPPAPPPR
jgi:hypothetical protein